MNAVTKLGKRLMVAVSGLFLIGALSAQAEFRVPDGLAMVNKGYCSFTLLDFENELPIIAAPIALLDADSGDAVHVGQTSSEGLYSADLQEGRYVLSVGSILVSVIDVADGHELDAIRIVMPRDSLLIGSGNTAQTPPMDENNEGEADVEEDQDMLVWIWVGGTFIGVSTVAGVAAAVEHHNDSGGGGGEVVTLPVPEGSSPSSPPPAPEPEPEPEEPTPDTPSVTLPPPMTLSPFNCNDCISSCPPTDGTMASFCVYSCFMYCQGGIGR